MAYADRAGRARTNPRAPDAFGVCDSCGTWYNRKDLKAQFEWRGDALIDTGFRDCYRCISKPQAQLRTIVLPLDPIPVVDPRAEVPVILQNLNGFGQNVGPQGESINDPVLTELDPTEPFVNKTQLLASAATGWGLPAPSLTDRSGTIVLSGVGQQAMAANPSRKYLLIYQPVSGFLAAAQNGTPNLGIPASTFLGQNLYAPAPPAELGTITIGTGSALLQNGLTTPPGQVWLGSVWVLGLIAGQPFWAWEG